MIHTNILDTDSTEALLLFGGWGTEPEPWAKSLGELSKHERRSIHLFWGGHADDPRHDLKALKNVFDTLKTKRLIVLGWSFGVRYALDTLLRFNCFDRVDYFVALGGTYAPIDERFGIAPRIFKATADQFSFERRKAFLENVTGLPASSFDQWTPIRSVEDWLAELRLPRQFEPAPENAPLPDLAIIPTKDRIIPVKRQREAWMTAGVPVIEIDAPHVDDSLWLSMFERLSHNGSRLVI